MNNLDKFYTNSSTVEECINILKEYVDIDYDKDLIIEPSAGNGAFIPSIKTLVNNYKFYDIAPEDEEIIEQDFLTINLNELKDENNNGKIIILGNVPFGKNNSLAIKFFNKSAEIANVIAFIIPKTFKKISLQNKLSLEFILLNNYDLPMKPCCFNPPMNAKCSFQIWIKTDIKRSKIIMPKIHNDFNFLKYGPNNPQTKQPTPPDGAEFALKAYVVIAEN